MNQTRPANPLDVNAFAKWAALNGYPTLVGESPAEQYAAYKAAKATGTTPVAPTPVKAVTTNVNNPAAPVQALAPQPVQPAPAAAPVQQAPAPPAQTITPENWRASIDGPAGQPIVTPTFASTGAVKLPTATVTPTAAGYTAPKTTAPTGPSRPGYVAPSGRVYANWVPKRKVA